MKRQECGECGAILDLIYMACPLCGSLNVREINTDNLPLRFPDEEDMPDVFTEEDICRENGHNWVVVSIGGEECDQCTVCGAVDC